MKLARYDLYRYSLPFSRPLTLRGTRLFQREGLLRRHAYPTSRNSPTAPDITVIAA